MNLRMISYLLGWVLNVQSLCMLLPVAVGIFYQEPQWQAFGIVAFCSLLLGVLLTLKKPKRTAFYTKEGFVTVAMSWLMLSLCGAVPFVLTTLPDGVCSVSIVDFTPQDGKTVVPVLELFNDMGHLREFREEKLFFDK